MRTVRLSAGDVPIAGALWERLTRMGGLDVRAATEIAVLLIRAELAGEFPLFNFEEVSPILRAGLHSREPEARELAERAIHSLGEHGFEKFGRLLQEGQQDDG